LWLENDGLHFAVLPESRETDKASFRLAVFLECFGVLHPQPNRCVWKISRILLSAPERCQHIRAGSDEADMPWTPHPRRHGQLLQFFCYSCHSAGIAFEGFLFGGSKK